MLNVLAFKKSKFICEEVYDACIQTYSNKNKYNIEYVEFGEPSLEQLNKVWDVVIIPARYQGFIYNFAYDLTTSVTFTYFPHIDGENYMLKTLRFVALGSNTWSVYEMIGFFCNEKIRPTSVEGIFTTDILSKDKKSIRNFQEKCFALPDNTRWLSTSASLLKSGCKGGIVYVEEECGCSKVITMEKRIQSHIELGLFVKNVAVFSELMYCRFNITNTKTFKGFSAADGECHPYNLFCKAFGYFQKSHILGESSNTESNVYNLLYLDNKQETKTETLISKQQDSTFKTISTELGDIKIKIKKVSPFVF